MFSLTSCVTEEPKHNLSGLFDETPSWALPAQPGQPLRLKPAEESLAATDPCCNNLHNLIGALLLYYSSHRVLPETLDQLPALAPGGEQFRIACPVSGKPYVYFPQGFRADQVYDRLIVFDAAASHDGIRYAVVMEPIVPNRALNMFVIPLKQNLLDYYLQSTQRVEQRPFIQPQ